MESQRMGFLARIALAWRLLFDAFFAGRVGLLLLAPSPPAEPEPALPGDPDPTTALQLLAILQREGRFVDFLEEEVASFGDADIGAAARVVHAGCKKALDEYMAIEAVRAESEGDEVVLPPGFDPTRFQVTGKVVGEPPFRGRLAHHGWQVTRISLPSLVLGHDPYVVAPAEVEI